MGDVKEAGSPLVRPLVDRVFALVRSLNTHALAHAHAIERGNVLTFSPQLPDATRYWRQFKEYFGFFLEFASIGPVPVCTIPWLPELPRPLLFAPSDLLFLFLFILETLFAGHERHRSVPACLPRPELALHQSALHGTYAHGTRHTHMHTHTRDDTNALLVFHRSGPSSSWAIAGRIRTTRPSSRASRCWPEAATCRATRSSPATKPPQATTATTVRRRRMCSPPPATLPPRKRVRLPPPLRVVRAAHVSCVSYVGGGGRLIANVGEQANR